MPMTRDDEKVTAPAVPLTAAEQERRAEQEEVGEFLVFLSNGFRRGRFALDMARAMKTLTQAVRKHNKRGTVTIKWTVEPVRNAPPGSVQVDAELTVKAPHGERPRTVMFSTPDGRLTLDHPDQVAAFEIPGSTGGAL